MWVKQHIRYEAYFTAPSYLDMYAVNCTADVSANKLCHLVCCIVYLPLNTFAFFVNTPLYITISDKSHCPIYWKKYKTYIEI